MAANAIQTTEKPKKETKIQQLAKYLESESIMKRFNGIMGHEANAYVSSVLLVVKNSEALQKCSLDSIYSAALGAANLHLSVDKNLNQAYIIPYNGQAMLIASYKGLYDMAVRTGKYRYINVGPIYEGVTVEENLITGFHVLTGQRVAGAKIIGWIGAFEMNPERGMVTGYAKTLYMTVEEIHEYAKKYSPSYSNPKGLWQKEPAKMERKTVLRTLLRKWGYIDPKDQELLNTIESENSEAKTNLPDIPEYVEVENLADKPKKTSDEIVSEMGFDQTAYRWNDAKIIEAVSSGLGYDKETSLQALKEAHTAKRISDNLTISDARAFVNEILGA